MAKFKAENHLITLKGATWLKSQKRAGRCVAQILKSCKDAVVNKQPNLSLKDLEDIAYMYFKANDCTPTFKDYKGFPSAICASVNTQLVHGIVDDYVLKEGDVVKLDLGATFEGAIADSALTCIYGRPKSQTHMDLIDACEKSLDAGLNAVKVGNRIGAIGNAIHKFAKNTEFGLITEYGGHGISWNKPHAPPFVANKSKTNDGIRIQPGLTIAIEPMLVIGRAHTKVLKDGWTVATPEIGAHFEHTIFVDDNDVIHKITERQNDTPNYMS